MKHQLTILLIAFFEQSFVGSKSTAASYGC